ncbi:enoyl-[acyl-carrier-protein] reductase, mitochondrial-like [Dysidea avara]|uniref:enoyl-[acyl-carrier-protein] reductase, mitochondrial-like n=1 Tax=Dysidea avara TaxID=196820 RepID=UPI0033305EEA
MHTSRVFTRWLIRAVHSFKQARNYSEGLVYAKYGTPEDVLELQEVQIPSVGRDDVKVKVIAAPVNPSDVNVIQGTYPLSPRLPAFGGNEVVGMVTEVGSTITSLKLGDHVIAAQPGIGTWRDTIVCHYDKWLRVPSQLPIQLAATLMVNPATAYRMMSDFVQLEEGDTIIQNGANSGVGQAVIQLAASRNINTINIIRDRPNIDEIKHYLDDLGATVVITEEENSKRDIRSIYECYKSAKLGLNTVGGDSATNLMRQLQQQAVMVTYGGMSRKPVMLPTGSLIFKEIKFVGYWNAKWIERNKNSGPYHQMYDDLIRLGVEGKLKPPKCTEHLLQNYKTALSQAMTSFAGSKQLFVLN